MNVILTFKQLKEVTDFKKKTDKWGGRRGGVWERTKPKKDYSEKKKLKMHAINFLHMLFIETISMS